MATTQNFLPEIIPGNLIPIDRTIGDLKTDSVVTDAYFGLKLNADDDALLPGFTELHITRTPLADGAVILNPGALIDGSWLAEVLFWLHSVVTSPLSTGTLVAYYIDVILQGQTERMTSEVGIVRVALGGKSNG